MKQGKRILSLTPHFRTRWRERIGNESEGQMRRVLHAALLEKSALKHRFHYFTIDVRGRRAVFSVEATGKYCFITVLQRGMKVEGVTTVERGKRCEANGRFYWLHTSGDGHIYRLPKDQSYTLYRRTGKTSYPAGRNEYFVYYF